MRKEVIIAIVIGLSLGLLITYGVYTASRDVASDSPLSSPSLKTADSTPTVESTELVISTPVDESIQKEKAVTIAGTTIGESFVVILINGKENITTADADGNFSSKAELQPGSNLIQVVALTAEGKKLTQERTVILATDEPSEQTSTPSASAKPKP